MMALLAKEGLQQGGGVLCGCVCLQETSLQLCGSHYSHLYIILYHYTLCLLITETALQNHLWTLVVSRHRVAVQLVLSHHLWGVFLFIALLWLLESHRSSSQCLLFPSPWLKVLPFGAKWPLCYFGHVCPCHLFPTPLSKLFLSVWKSLSHALLTYFFPLGSGMATAASSKSLQTPPTQDCHRGLAWRMALWAATQVHQVPHEESLLRPCWGMCLQAEGATEQQVWSASGAELCVVWLNVPHADTAVYAGLRGNSVSGKHHFVSTLLFSETSHAEIFPWPSYKRPIFFLNSHH